MDIQEIFNRIQEAKKQQREIKSAYRDALANSEEYKKASEEIKILKEKKKKIEETIKADFNSEFAKLDGLKLDIETDNILLSDLALNTYAKGEKIEIKDQYENQYEPVFSVRFRKAKEFHEVDQDILQR